MGYFRPAAATINKALHPNAVLFEFKATDFSEDEV
jgi:hypothetical protein